MNLPRRTEIIRNQLIVSYCTIIAFAILYEHQPLLPLFAKQWDRSISETAFITTVTVTPLAFAPLIYGYILEQFSSRNLLLAGFAVLLISQSLLATAPSYSIFLVLRAIEGLVLPAILTSLMTYMSSTGGVSNARKYISFYIASTIVGGYSGRIVTGLVTDWSDWQTAFWLWSVLTLIAVIFLFKLDADPRRDLQQISFTEIRKLLKRPINKIGLTGAFLIMFVFSGTLNFLPFRLTEINPGISAASISLVYSGYLIGIVVSLLSGRIISVFGSERDLLFFGASVFLIGNLLFLSTSTAVIFYSMFVFAAGMFILHSVFSGYLNHLEHSRKGMINGLYVSSYYTGAALGSFLPGLLYQSTGWLAFCLLTSSLIILLLVLTRLLPVSK